MLHRRLAGAALAAAALGAAAPAAQADHGLAVLTDGNVLLEVDRATPDVELSAPVAITGLAPGERIVGIDRRPATGGLYAVVGAPLAQARVARIDAAGALVESQPLVRVTQADATAPIVNTGEPIVLGALSGDIDFNPVPDRLRVVTTAEDNLRINVANGFTFRDGTLSRDVAIVGAAYENNDAVASTGTTLFDIDTATDTLFTQNPPNAGTLVDPRPLGRPAGEQVGFDVFSPRNAAGAATGNVAYASFAKRGDDEKLVRVDTATGAVKVVGSFGRQDVADIAVPLGEVPAPPAS